MFTSYIALTVGVVVAFFIHLFAGQLAGFGATALWSIGTAYFVMPPFHSLHVSQSGDWTALTLFGVIGLVIARSTPASKRPVPTQAFPRIERYPPALVNINGILADLITSSALGGRLREREIEVVVGGLQTFPCSYMEAVSVLSHVFADALFEPGLRRLSVQVVMQPKVAMLFVWAHTVWPLPLESTIAIGRCAEDSTKAAFAGWLSNFTVTWFDNGYGRIYQIVRPTGSRSTVVACSSLARPTYSK